MAEHEAEDISLSENPYVSPEEIEDFNHDLEEFSSKRYPMQILFSTVNLGLIFLFLLGILLRRRTSLLVF